MANAIELPGEANPLTAQNLFNALASAASSTQQQVRIGTQQLQNWEKLDGFYLLLQVGGLPCLCAALLTICQGSLSRPHPSLRDSLSFRYTAEEWSR